MGALHEYLSRDHDRLDALLRAALREDGTIDDESFTEFRRGLLRHIGIEEKILFLYLRIRGGETELQRQLHRDHAALAALLVPAPSASGIREIRAILTDHNPLEEDDGGLYAIVEETAGNDLREIVESAEATPEVRLAKYSDTPLLRETIERLVREAAEGRRRLHEG